MARVIVVATSAVLTIASVSIFWALKPKEPAAVAHLEFQKQAAVTPQVMADDPSHPTEHDSQGKVEKPRQQVQLEEAPQQPLEIPKQQERDAEQRKEEFRLQQERNQEQRVNLLADIDRKAKDESPGHEADVAKYARTGADLSDKIAQIERTLGISREMVGGVMIIKPGANPANPRVKQLQGQLESLEKQRDTAKSQQVAAEKKRGARLAELEQERRRIQVKFPLQGDPKFVEHKGFLRTTDELAKIKLFEDEHSSPQQAADYYVKSLLDKKVLKDAEFLRVAAVELPMEAFDKQWPIKASRTVHYRVVYVSKGGIVNDRQAWVTVFTLEDGYWYVSPHMKQFQVLSGLK